jgi:glucose/arabinose dehydrogenase
MQPRLVAEHSICPNGERWRSRLGAALASATLACCMLVGCQSHSGSAANDNGAAGATSAPGKKFCDLPGSLRFTTTGRSSVPGDDGSALAFLTLPAGFCVHRFGNVGNARQLRFAPGGELFVASPITPTTGGGSGGLSAIMVLPDDNRDGLADTALAFVSGVASTQGLLFANSSLYYQDARKILRIPYASGDRTPTAASQVAAEISGYASPVHWPRPLDQSDDGTIYVGNGSDESETCDPSRPFQGGILALGDSPDGTQVAKGFRNPIAIRCQRGHDRCYAVELALDYSADDGGREKLVPIRPGDDWGFPCCFSKNVPVPGITPTPDCSGVASEDDSFLIGDTPFAFDFEPGIWPSVYRGSIFVPLHGAASTWQGARLVAVAVDATTGLPKKGSSVDGGPTGAMTNFATGWDDGTRGHGRPSAVAFAADGRLFVANDNDGSIFWVAPLELPR